MKLCLFLNPHLVEKIFEVTNGRFEGMPALSESKGVFNEFSLIVACEEIRDIVLLIQILNFSLNITVELQRSNGKDIAVLLALCISLPLQVIVITTQR